LEIFKIYLVQLFITWTRLWMHRRNNGQWKAYWLFCRKNVI